MKDEAVRAQFAAAALTAILNTELTGEGSFDPRDWGGYSQAIIHGEFMYDAWLFHKKMTVRHGEDDT
jgi:hypothetical protein